MTSILDLEAWLSEAGLHDRHEARALYDAVSGMCAVAGFECLAHRGSAPWLVRSPHSADTLVLTTPVHREALLGMLRQRHGLAQAPSSKLAHWRLPAHVSALPQEPAPPLFRPHA